ncbi:hypothetical protein DEU56DRAFT_742871 [Suillus clintonianus]|uniref:uncharacterized protein n=1 Tax=Suillus clintonianus TaxID=1904413 RepID=UPI001B875C3E|nr:uncharacterized protein DEU56DRAFT_742871 [Suillus clintonianus]KAG2126547.1 hypothetical protein DEU56DRAFT_742871 [Suillus clintonianus]
MIFRLWPRDPKGLAIKPSPLRGKEAGNGIDLWGATLYDFYHVRRLPNVQNFITNSSGSRLAKWMRQNGELIAQDELFWADKEEDPKEIPVADIGELITCYDTRVNLGTLDQYSSPAAPLPTINSPFHPDHYPSPHPFIPCTHDDNPTLQQRIPLHLLPQKLYVHDPWNKLSIDEGDTDYQTPWLSKVAKRDIVRTYSLSLSPEGKEKALKEQKLVEIAEEEATKEESLLHIFPSDKEGPTEDPLIAVILPPRPRKRTQVEEAHLYLSSRAMGTGNHSVVHSVEWELPRDVFIETRMCRACVELDALDESKEPSALGSASREDKGKGEEVPEESDGDEEEEEEEEELFTIEPPRVVRMPSYTGPCLRIYTNVKWRGPTEACGHGGGLGSGAVPRTATLRVVAKLSIEHDLHLAREASNYQSFPDHFFQHWNGYNVMPPLHDPVPVGALCPQFYGYYTPDDPSDGTGRPDYLSPILLLEYCGQEINPDELCLDDRQECASLVFRFHHAGWLHESFAARNILWQQGKPTEWPILRPHSSKSFRLIDFGRSKKLDKAITRANEEETASRLLHLFHHAGMQ